MYYFNLLICNIQQLLLYYYFKCRMANSIGKVSRTGKFGEQ